MEHNIGFTFHKDFAQVLALTDISQNNALIIQARLAGDRQLSVHQQGLIPVKHHEQLRVKTVNLTAQFRTDRTTGPGDQHTFPRNIRAKQLVVHLIVNLAAHQLHDFAIVRLIHRIVTHQALGGACNATGFDTPLTHPFPQHVEGIFRVL